MRTREDTQSLHETLGEKVRVTVMKDKYNAKVDFRALASMAKQLNYHASMIYDGLTGITELDRPVNVYSVTNPEKQVGSFSLCEIMFNCIKLPGKDKLLLVAEIHQQTLVSSVDNFEEAESMVAMINKHIAAYLFHYLQRVRKMDKKFVMELLQVSINPSLMHSIDLCTWNIEIWCIKTTGDKDREEAVAAMEKVAWYKDTFVTSDEKKRNTPKKLYCSTWTMISRITQFASVLARHMPALPAPIPLI